MDMINNNVLPLVSVLFVVVVFVVVALETRSPFVALVDLIV